MVTTPPAGPGPADEPAPGPDEAIHHAAALLRGAEAVLLDFNGTLSLDEDLLEDCYAFALAALSLPPMADGEYAALLGRSERDIAEALLETRGAGSVSATVAGVGTEQLLAEVAGAYADACARRPRIPDSHLQIVRRLHALGIPLAIVTGTLRSMITPVLAQTGLDELLPVVVTIEDVTRGKPDPEGFLRAAELLGVEASHAVVVEDSSSGVAATRALGAATIGVGPSPHGADVAIEHLGQVAGLV